MSKANIKINYLYNSSFKVELEKHVLIFDYYNDKTDSLMKNSSSGVIGEEDLESDKKIVVFASHSHGDHFNEVIFNWREQRNDIEYILSSDIKLKKFYDNFHIMSEGQELKLGNLFVKAYGSTDIGISFLIKLENMVIFHAGDLNWWHWYDESDEDNIAMEKSFKKEIEIIKGEQVDLAFFPVDPRLRESCALGPEYLIEKIKPKVLVPMHFREDYYITKEFANKNKKVKVIEINNRGEQIIIDK